MKAIMSGKSRRHKKMDRDALNKSINQAVLSMSADRIRLRLAKEDDASFILRLRTDGELNAHLSPTSDQLSHQEEWLRQYEVRHANGQEHYFIIEHDRQPVGTVRMYDYQPSDKSFCWGSWIVQRAASPSCALTSVLRIYDIGFRSAGFLTARFDVRADNKSVLAFHRRMGADEVGQKGPDVYFRICRNEYENIVRPKLLTLYAKVS